MKGWRDDFPPINLFNYPKKMISEVDIRDMSDTQPLYFGLSGGQNKPVKETIRGSVLNEANSIVNGARADVYGGPEDSFGVIAGMWSTYLGRIVSGTDVAALMALLKIARLKNSPGHRDSWVDIAGYAACGAEIGLK